MPWCRAYLNRHLVTLGIQMSVQSMAKKIIDQSREEAPLIAPKSPLASSRPQARAGMSAHAKDVFHPAVQLSDTGRVASPPWQLGHPVLSLWLESNPADFFRNHVPYFNGQLDETRCHDEFQQHARPIHRPMADHQGIR